MKRAFLWAGAAAFAAVPLVMSAPQALASQYGQLHGNVAKALLRGSKSNGPASPSAQVTLFLGFNFQTPSNLPALPTFIQDSVTPGNPYFHQFLSESQFAQAYAPSSTQVNALLNYLAQYQIQPQPGNAYTMGLNVTGAVGNIEKAFGVSINNYLSNGRSFIANDENPSLPTDYTYHGQSYNLASLVSGVAGMTTYSHFTTHTQQQQNVSNLNTQNGPVGYSPQQMAKAYNAFPTSSGITGKGVTIGIATLAPFVPSDAQFFWNYYHINRGQATLSEVGVDGQSTSASGYGVGGSETSLDVERSGAMAPSSNIVVYEAPNTNPGFIDLFQAAATADKVQVMSTSWGEAEFYQPFSYSYMMNQAYMQGAAEGMSMMAASGDSGAYDGWPAVRSLAVDSPASSPDILAVGGTTLPMVSTTPNANPIAPGSSQTGYIPIPNGTISMTGEQAWGWQYLLPYYQNFGMQNEAKWKRLIYPVGSTGGYSNTWTSTTGNNLYGWWQQSAQNSGARGVPDVALNADPFTGYAIYDTNSVYTSPTAGWTNGWGGTSFAAPQWAGITALMDQYLGGPQGLINAALYANEGGTGFNQITQGNNWYYSAAPGWNPVTGLGTPNVQALAQDIAHWETH